MEKKEQVVKMGVLRLLPGFRFHPTDQELVLDYLKRKAFSLPLPASIIPVVLNLSNSDPWDLPGDLEQERYFFSTRDIKYPNTSTSGGNYRSNRVTSSGYWKATGLDKKILVLGGGRGNNHQQVEEEVVGMKKTLVFYTRKPPHGSRTHWIMHEYRLTLPPQSQLQDQVHNWVLCRIFPKKRGIAKNRVVVDDEKITEHTNNNIDTVHSSTLGKKMKKKKNSPPVFMANNSSTKKRSRITDLNVPASTSSSSSSSSASSGITEASDHGESSSCCSNTNNK